MTALGFTYLKPMFLDSPLSASFSISVQVSWKGTLTAMI